MEDLVVSVFRDDGAGLVFLYYLETEPSRTKMVGALEIKEAKDAGIRFCNRLLFVRHYGSFGPYNLDRCYQAAYEQKQEVSIALLILQQYQTL